MFDPNAPQSSPAPQPPIAPAVVPTPSVPVMPAPQSTPVRKGKGLVVALVALLVLILAGVAGAAYYLFVMEPAPEKVLGEAVLAMEDVQTFTYDFSMTIEGTAPAPEVPSNIIGMPLAFDTTILEGGEEAANEPVPIKVSVTAKGAVAMPDEGAQLFSSDMDVSVLANGERFVGVTGMTRAIDDATYVQLTDVTVPLPEEFGIANSLFDVLLNRWISFDPHDFGNVGDYIDTLQEKASAEAAAHEEDVRSAFMTYGAQVVTITEIMDREDINGVESRHYAFTLNKDAMVGLFTRLDEITSDDGEGSEKTVEDFQTFLDTFENPQGEVWIGKENALVRRVVLTWEQSMDDDVTFHGTLTLNLDKFNETVAVEAPEDADEVMQVLMELMQAAEESADADADGDGLTMKEEARYGTSDENVDTDGDGFEDGAEVEAGYNPNGEGAL